MWCAEAGFGHCFFLTCVARRPQSCYPRWGRGGRKKRGGWAGTYYSRQLNTLRILGSSENLHWTLPRKRKEMLLDYIFLHCILTLIWTEISFWPKVNILNIHISLVVQVCTLKDLLIKQQYSVKVGGFTWLLTESRYKRIGLLLNVHLILN